MDLERLDAQLTELQRRYQEWTIPLHQASEETRLKLNRDGYTEADRARDMEATYQKQLALYNPKEAETPVLEELLTSYVKMTAEERDVLQAITGKGWHTSGMLMAHILRCAKRLQTPNDSEILYSALIAASIENYSFDFRDTDMVLAELAVSARNAGINIEPLSSAAAELSSADEPKGGRMPMKTKLAHFHIYAQVAERVV
jgi:hypothetical protein